VANVVIAPDSFKGSRSAIKVAEAIATGWRTVRPSDHLSVLPMADGGEGTLDAIAYATPQATWHHDSVTGPEGSPVEASWLMLPDKTAVLELAQTSGLPLMSAPDPLGATTRGLGELIAIAMSRGATGVMIGLGGSATTDAGLGALEALGATLSRSDAHPTGAIGVTGVEASGLQQPPVRGITLLSDTTAVMFDAPSVFGPQKGATPDDVRGLEEAFSRLVAHSPQHSTHLTPGSGAAGATAWGLMTFLGATIQDGAAFIADLIGVTEALKSADLVITGEGKFDHTSLRGKVVGHIYGLASSTHTRGALIVGTSDDTVLEGWSISRLVDSAPSTEEAIRNPETHLISAVAQLARGY
jgi:glycerate kinase